MGWIGDNEAEVINEMVSECPIRSLADSHYTGALLLRDGTTMATEIKVTQDVVYKLAGKTLTMSADSIVQSSTEQVGTPQIKEDAETYTTLFTGPTQSGPVVWSVTAEYCFETQSIDEVELVKCPDGIEIIQDLAVEIVQVDSVDDDYIE